MKNVFYRLTIMAMAIGFAAANTSCDEMFFSIKGNGHIVSSERGVSDFEKIQSSGACDVRFHVGEEYRAVVIVDENLNEYVEIFTRNNTLHIRTEEHGSYHFTKFVVNVYAPTLNDISMSGSGSFEGMDTIASPTFEATVSGSGKLKGTVVCEHFSSKISGSGTIKISGSCEEAKLAISGSGDFFGSEFKVKDAAVSISGSGHANVWATDNLTAKISGSGDLNYRGEPKVDATVTGSGRIREM